VILCKPDMAQAIRDGRKTVTRRQGKKRWNVGSEHLCYTRPPFAKGGAKPFARVRIVDVKREKRPMNCTIGLIYGPGDPWMNVEARREGFRDDLSGRPTAWESFWLTYRAINGVACEDPCWRVEFELVEVLEAP